jgi:hypothetical protein
VCDTNYTQVGNNQVLEEFRTLKLAKKKKKIIIIIKNSKKKTEESWAL